MVIWQPKYTQHRLLTETQRKHVLLSFGKYFGWCFTPLDIHSNTKSSLSCSPTPYSSISQRYVFFVCLKILFLCQFDWCFTPLKYPQLLKNLSYTLYFSSLTLYLFRCQTSRVGCAMISDLGYKFDESSSIGQCWSFPTLLYQQRP